MLKDASVCIVFTAFSVKTNTEEFRGADLHLQNFTGKFWLISSDSSQHSQFPLLKFISKVNGCEEVVPCDRYNLATLHSSLAPPVSPDSSWMLPTFSMPYLPGLLDMYCLKGQFPPSWYKVFIYSNSSTRQSK